MNIYVTELRAESIETGVVSLYKGPNIYAPTFKLAEKWCADHMPFLKVLGKLSMEGTFKNDGDIDWGNAIDYEKREQN